MRSGQFQIDKSVGDIAFTLSIKLSISIDPNNYPITACPLPMIENPFKSHPQYQEINDGIQHAIEHLPRHQSAHIDTVTVTELKYTPSTPTNGLAEYGAYMALFDAFDYKPSTPPIYNFTNQSIHYPCDLNGSFECGVQIEKKGFYFKISLEVVTYDELPNSNTIQIAFYEENHKWVNEIKQGLKYAINGLPKHLKNKLSSIYIENIEWMPVDTKADLVKFGSCMALWDALDFNATTPPTFDYSRCKADFPMNETN